MSFADAVRLLFVSFDSTVKSNLSVGLPLDLHIYENDSFHTERQRRIEETDEAYVKTTSQWSTALKAALENLEPIEA